MPDAYLNDGKIGDRIKTVRISASINQKSFADYIGINQGHVSKIERGLVKPSFQLIKSICNAFGVNEGWLTTGKGRKRSKGLTLNEMIEEIKDAESLSRDQIIAIMEDSEQTLRKAEHNLSTIIFSKFEFDRKDTDLMIVKKRLQNAIDSLCESIDSFMVK